MHRRAVSLALASLGLVALVQCSTHFVSRSEPAVVDSRTIREETRLEVLSEPTVESPTARFLCTHLSHLEETQQETTVVRRELTKGGRILLGGLGLSALAVGLAMVPKASTDTGNLQAASWVSCLGVAALVPAALPQGFLHWTSTSVGTTVDTVTTLERPGLEVLDGERVVASLHPDRSGIAEFPVREYLQSLRDTLHDSRLTVRTMDPDTLSRSFLLPRSAVVKACEERRAELARQAREGRERRLAEKLVQKREQERRAHLGDSLVSAALGLKAAKARYDAAEYILKYRTPLSEVEQGARQLADMAERDYPAYVKYGRLLNEYVAAFGVEALYDLSLKYGFSDLLR
jgi:hypothetical protein